MRQALIAGLVRLSLAGAALLMGGVSLFALYGVFARYLFGASPIWFDELARYIIIYAVLLALGAVWVRDGHMRVDVLETRVPHSLRRVIRLYQWGATLVLAGGMAWFSFDYMGSVGFFKTPGLQVSRIWPVAAFPVGFGLLFVLVLLQGPTREE